MNANAQPRGFTLVDRGGRIKVHSLKGSGKGTVLVFKGHAKPKRVHI